MGRSYVRLMGLLVLGSAAAPILVYLASRTLQRQPLGSLGSIVLAGFTALIPAAVLLWVLKRLEGPINVAGVRQAEFLDAIPPRFVGPAIFASAAMSLFLELAVIRWQATVLELFAFYKNFSLLACFAGLGLGYALASRKSVPLFLTAPLLCWQFLLLLGLRYGLSTRDRSSLRMLPFPEQLNMGLPVVNSLFNSVQTYFLLGLVFLLTALALVPVGQLCGNLLNRREKLSGYGLNLAGSITGVLLMFLASAFWTPPVVWFLLAFALLLLFHVWAPRPLLFGATAIVLSLIALSWPADSEWQRIYSPYQLLEVGHDDQGLMLISAAGHYYQGVHDLARSNRNVDADPGLNHIRNYYELPYQVYGRAPASVAVVGAGSGNDVAAALRNGAVHVDAIEIDPAILMEGKAGHPEHPYSDPRVLAAVNDARTFLRNTEKNYNMVVYGLLDSHVLLSQASSVRLDSFVYTVEGLREARKKLNPGGVLSLSFSVLNWPLGGKIYRMLEQAFDGRAPICVRAGYDGAVIFLEAADRPLLLAPELLQKTGFQDVSADFAAKAATADVSTDDWPFFYMPKRIYPLSYILMAALILMLSGFMFTRFLEGRPQFGSAPFFFLGAGFMLVETKAITELGLAFGNSWQVIGVAILAILLMAFLANALVERWRLQRPWVAYLLLLLTLAVGWLVAGRGGLPSTWAGRLGLALLLTSPVFFSGTIFSNLLRSRGGISGMMAVNLLGAMCGGLLEYNSMYFGFRFLYVLAGILYVLAFVLERLKDSGAVAVP